tara:strand:- start:2091 stop:2714 length:624 start_codon:yes stop_codon:yes gene_type:complete
MARNFKMFDHVVAPETRYRSWALMRSKPLEMFLCFQFVYMLFSLFSYRSLLNSYLMLTIYCFIISYLDYFKTIIFEKAFRVISEMVRQHSEKIVMAPFMKNPDIGDYYMRTSDELEEEAEEAEEAEDVTEDVGEDMTEDVAEDVVEDVGGDDSDGVVEGAEQDENETENAVDVQKDMDDMVQETSSGWTIKDPTSYLELRQRHVPRG